MRGKQDRVAARCETMEKKFLLLTVSLVVLEAFGVLGWAMSPKQDAVSDTPLTLDYLLNAPVKELKAQLPKFDIAQVNLVCAQGLPGAEDLNPQEYLNTLDKWAEWIRLETDRCRHQFDRDLKYYYDSLPYYKILMLVTVLQLDIGVGYNMDLVNSGIMYDFQSTRFNTDSKDVFVHGLLSSHRKGSCSSMPVLVIAIRRRLGYPLKLVRAKGHLFTRWEAAGDRFNIETSGQGLAVYSDSRYRQ